ncbi:MAG: arginine--tRNA ligase, partial [Phycisphaeraceae bacterium]
VAKEMHVGHIRSTVIGDAVVRTLAFQGHDVIRQNHVGDWGTQFGMLIESVLQRGWAKPDGQGKTDIGDLNRFYQEAKRQFDADPDFADRARRRVVLLQQGDEQTLNIWRYLVEQSKHHFRAIYDRLDVTLTEDDIRPESFYNDQLPDVVTELENKGLAEQSDGAVCIFMPQFLGTDDKPLPLIIRKQGGGFLYATTDLAAVRHRIRDLHADRVIYVTDARQKQHFAMFFEAARLAGWVEGVRLDHVVFGTILGEDNKPFKTRSGETVRLVDLLDEAEQRAAGIIAEKNPDLDESERQQVAHVVGIGAVKYGDLSSDRVKDYVFSWDRMLAMDGNTAPYLQYAYTRIRSIQRKAAEAGAAPAAAGANGFEIAGESVQGVTHDAERALVLKLTQFASVVDAVGEHLEPHRMCTYLFDLATTFSSFYERCPVLRADSPTQICTRLALCELTADTLKQALNLLGIDVLERM